MARATQIGALKPGDPEYVGPFRLVGRIGAGGMGVVYLAQSEAGAPVAIKVIRSELTQDPVIRKRFLREVDAARRVRSPVTAAVLDAGAEADPAWVAFEYIDSPNLEEVVKEQVPRLSAAIGILSGIAEALIAIHEVGIIHRDLKPSNILCPPNGVKVIDFGIAAAKEGTSLTGVSGFVGTPAWLSPEQLLGNPITPAVDVFAWGCTAVYTLTGRHPFLTDEDVPAAVYYRIVNVPVDLSGVPRQLLRPVSAALSKDPLGRPPVAELLEMLLPGSQTSASPSPLAMYQQERFVPPVSSPSAPAQVRSPLAPLSASHPGQQDLAPAETTPPHQQFRPSPPPPNLWSPAGVPAPPPGYLPPADRQETSRLATWSLVLGIASVALWWIGSIAAVILGLFAIKAIKASGGAKKGRSLAVAGIVIGIVTFVVLTGLLIIGLVEPNSSNSIGRSPSARITTSDRTASSPSSTGNRSIWG